MTTNAKKIPIDLVRKLSVINQGLHQLPSEVNKYTIKNIVSKIGILQLDSINVVERSHYIVLFSRLGCYDKTFVDALQHPDRELVEQWVHVASLIPIKDFSNICPNIISKRNSPLSNRQERILGENKEQKLKEILDRIKNEGPISSSAFKEINPNREFWWSKKPNRVALDVLFRLGYIAVSHRRNFTCYYDIQEKVATLDTSGRIIDYYTWVVLKTVEILGVASMDHIIDYYRINRNDAQSAIKLLKKEGKIKNVEVENWNEELYTTDNNIKLLNEIASNKITIKHTTILSPFDNLIWNRGRTELLFGFYYRSEMYTPDHLRKFGYYVLPILHDGELIGRINPKYDRKQRLLIIKDIYLEPKVKTTVNIVKSLSVAIKQLATFLGAKDIKLENHQSMDFLSKINQNVSDFNKEKPVK